MGIDIEAKLMYGMDMIDIDDEFSEDIETGLENDVLQCASPFYDSPLIFWFIGFEISEGEVVAGKVDWESIRDI